MDGLADGQANGKADEIVDRWMDIQNVSYIDFVVLLKLSI
jgi:hypothetical protein